MTATAVLTPMAAYATVSPVEAIDPIKLHESSKEVEMFDLLSQEQIIVIVTALIIQALKIIWVGVLKKPKPSKGKTRLLVFIVSIPVALIGGGFAAPVAGENPMQYAIALVAMAGEVLLYGHVLYEAILKGVLEWLDKGKKLLAP